MEYWLVLQSPDAASGSRAERRVVTTGYIAKTLRRCLKLRVNGAPLLPMWLVIWLTKLSMKMLRW